MLHRKYQSNSLMLSYPTHSRSIRAISTKYDTDNGTFCIALLALLLYEAFLLKRTEC